MPNACSSGHTVGAEDGDPEKMSQAASAQTSCISYYSARATASCSRMFWWREDAQQFRLLSHEEAWDMDNTLMTPA